MGESGSYRKKLIVVLAKRLSCSLSVPVADGDASLAGIKGDWLVQYSPGEFGIVSADIFNKTYELLD